MCHPDLSLMPFEWLEDQLFPRPILDVPRECVNWDSIQNWAVDHSFDLNSPAVKHPVLGRFAF
jgi:hypothetical protein